MSRFTVEVLPEAEEEFRQAFLWYFERSPIASDAFRSQVLEAIDDLTGQRPNVRVEAGPPAKRQARRRDDMPLPEPGLVVCRWASPRTRG